MISTSTAERPDTPSAKVLSYLRDARASVAVTQEAQVGILITLEGGQASAEAINWR